MEPLPFSESYDEPSGCWIRIFPGDLDPMEMDWHWDEEDRIFEVISGSSWKFQRDNQIPHQMVPGMKISVKAGEYHRGIKPLSCEDLVIKVFKASDPYTEVSLEIPRFPEELEL